MAAPMLTFSRWRKMHKTYFQIAEYKTWLKKHKKKKLADDKQPIKRNTESHKSNDVSSLETHRKTLKLHTSGALFETYRSTLEMRSNQALRSVLVKCSDNEVTYVLTALQMKFKSNIVEAHSYSWSGEQRSLLVEFDSVPQPYSFIIDKRSLPKVRHENSSLLKKVKTHQAESFQTDTLTNCKDVSEQIMCLFNGVKMSEAMKRQHFFVGELVRNIVQRVHPAATVCMFGSSVSGIALEGKSDLDTVILLNGSEHDSVLKPLGRNMRNDINKLLFSDLFYIRGARVPILKFNQIHTRMSCDISCNHLGGVLMAEILFWLNEYEPMFHPLVTAVKVWAKTHHLSGTGPGNRLSNHMLTMLVITFLQQCDYLPSIQSAYVDNSLLSNLHSEDLISTWNNLRLKDTNAIMMAKLMNNDRQDIGTLLFQFFKFYSEFPFDESLLDVGYGKIIKSRHMNDIYMPNPYEKQHNMCQNAKTVSVARFKYLCQKSAEALHLYSTQSDHGEWGLMSILSRNKLLKYNKSSLVLDMDDIFNTDDGKVEEIFVEIDGSNQSPEAHVLKSHGSNHTVEACTEKHATVKQTMNANETTLFKQAMEAIEGTKPTVNQPIESSEDKNLPAKKSKKKSKKK